MGEFGLGIAPRHIKPVNRIELSKKKEEEIARMQADDDDHHEQDEEVDEEADSRLEVLKLKKQREAKRKPIDKQQAFLEFKQMAEGRTYEDQILSNRQDLKDKKLLVKQLTEVCNTTKRDIDTVKAKLDEKAEEKKRQMREDLAGMEDDEGMGNGEGGELQQEIIDEEELSYLQRMKELKRSYRDNFEKLKNLRAEVFYIQQSIDTLKQQLVGAYEEWYQATFDTEEDYNATMVKKID